MFKSLYQVLRNENGLVLVIWNKIVFKMSEKS